ncbi:MAG TPA: hypothetical protein VFV33_20410, partial [Gemmatimonadaceae bacterium]|nr:hypothetical protein [Gemmatimonadaceae bacterium]
DEARSDIARRRRGGGGRRGGARRAGSSGPPQLPREPRADMAGLALLFSQATRIREGQDAMLSATEDKRMSSAEAANDNGSAYDQYASDRNADTIEARERRTYEQRYEALRGFSDLWEQEHSRQLTAVQGLVEGADAAFQSFGQAYSKHLGLLVSGEETAGQALQGFLADTLEGVSARTGARAGEEFAEGLASLASPITAPLAPAHFAAAAAFTGVSVATGVAGAAMRPSTPAAGAGGASRGASDLPPGVGTGRAPERREGTSITINLGGGVVLGSPRELAEQLGRVLNDPSADFLLNPDRVRTAA